MRSPYPAKRLEGIRHSLHPVSPVLVNLQGPSKPVKNSARRSGQRLHLAKSSANCRTIALLGPKPAQERDAPNRSIGWLAGSQLGFVTDSPRALVRLAMPASSPLGLRGRRATGSRRRGSASKTPAKRKCKHHARRQASTLTGVATHRRDHLARCWHGHPSR